VSQEHRTLFAIDLAAERARQRIDRPRKGAAGAGTSSDVRRHRLLLTIAVAAALGALVGWRLAPAPASGRGALALPHADAQLACTSCHQDDAPPAAACAGCHGAHPSTRARHRALAEQGKLGCVRCHDVHGSDQGVRFAAGSGAATRYGVGSRAAVDGVTLPGERAVTVPLVPLERCGEGCHDLGSSADPIGRCRGSDVSLCFDEHRLGGSVAPASGVCGAQHGADRFAAWEAARAVAHAAPAPPRAPETAGGWTWLASGAASALLAALGYAGVALVGARRRPRERVVVARPAPRVRLPQIDANTCLGCYACVDACPYEVLAIDRYVAQVARPEACCGLTLCEQVCPNGSLVITDGEPIGDRPRIGDDLQALDQPGVYLAGDVTGLPLIKNAILQGARAIDHVAASLPRKRGSAALDVVIVGAGPAGISAALRAKELGLSCEVLEQATVAQSIKSFPRGKLVFDQPLELPVAGPLWLAEATKEELLSQWARVIRQERLSIKEGERLVSIARDGDAFVIGAEVGDPPAPRSYRALRLLLAIGVRGTPRLLDAPIEAAMESKVFYHLADARSFSGQRVAVVGLGDVAMETAIALARQPDTTVTLLHRGQGFARGKSRNIAEVQRMAAAGQLELVFGATVGAVTAAGVRIDPARRTVPVDALFVMIGSRPAVALLEQAGVKLGPAA
jgi:thioredoxin reductase/NAD-dependent dihydropyrimidine dehydrogenase PreA subunit